MNGGVEIVDRTDALVEREARLVEHRHQHPVDDEAGDVARQHGLLAQLCGERPGGLVGRVRGGEPADDLYQLHERRRVHEVHADHALGPGDGGGNLGDADRRRVGRQHDAPATGLIEGLEDFALGLEALGRRLDDEVDRLQIAAVKIGGMDARQDLIPVSGGHLLLVDQLGELLPDGGPPAFGDVTLGVRDRDREPARRRELGDASPHLPGADHADAGDAVQRATEGRGRRHGHSTRMYSLYRRGRGARGPVQIRVS